MLCDESTYQHTNVWLSLLISSSNSGSPLNSSLCTTIRNADVPADLGSDGRPSISPLERERYPSAARITSALHTLPSSSAALGASQSKLLTLAPMVSATPTALALASSTSCRSARWTCQLGAPSSAASAATSVVSSETVPLPSHFLKMVRLDAVATRSMASLRPQAMSTRAALAESMRPAPI